MDKNSEEMNKLTAEITENLFDNVVLATTTSIFEEVVKAFPVTNAFSALFSSYQNMKQKRRATQFIKFVEECEKHQAGQILKVYKNKNNLEMGMEILNALEDSYLEIHAQMIARVAILYDSKQLDRSKFLKYAHIIPKLSSYLLEQIEICYNTYQVVKAEVKGKRALGDKVSKALTPELANWGLLESITTIGDGFRYSGTDELDYFYEYIYKNKYDKNF